MGTFVLLFYVCAELFSLVNLKVSTDTLRLVYANGPLEVAVSIRSERVSLNYALDINETSKSLAFATLKIISDEWKKLKYLENVSLKQEFEQKLSTGLTNFAIAGGNLKHAKRYLMDQTVKGKSECVFEANVLSKDLIISEPEFLKAEFNHIGKTWTAADLQSDPAKYTSLYSFIY
jgi:ribosomal protein L28